MAKDETAAKAFLANAADEPDAVFVRIEFFDPVDLDPASHPDLKDMGEWEWNDKHDHLMLIDPDGKSFNARKFMTVLRHDGVPETAYEVREIPVKDAKPELVA
ncbi:hypothetical protein [Lacticaseibacillus thailandensis]|nr:hypothetical protein [Lacticaseibacillus thailandensis]